MKTGMVSSLLLDTNTPTRNQPTLETRSTTSQSATCFLHRDPLGNNVWVVIAHARHKDDGIAIAAVFQEQDEHGSGSAGNEGIDVECSS